MTNGEVDGQFNLPEVAIVMIFGNFSNFNFYISHGEMMILKAQG